MPTTAPLPIDLDAVIPSLPADGAREEAQRLLAVAQSRTGLPRERMLVALARDIAAEFPRLAVREPVVSAVAGEGASSREDADCALAELEGAK